MSSNGADRPKRGRPKKHIDLELVEKLAHIQCTHSEIASTLGVSVDTLQRNPNFAATYKKGAEGGRKSLRRMQFESANRGNVAMQIWLGKQFLGQSDHRTEVQLRPEDMDPQQLLVVYQSMQPNDQLQFLKAHQQEMQRRIAELRGLPSATASKASTYNATVSANPDAAIDVQPVHEDGNAQTDWFSCQRIRDPKGSSSRQTKTP